MNAISDCALFSRWISEILAQACGLYDIFSDFEVFAFVKHAGDENICVKVSFSDLFANSFNQFGVRIVSFFECLLKNR